MEGLYKRAIKSRSKTLDEGYRKWIMVEKIESAGVYGVFTWWSEWDDHSCGNYYNMVWWSEDKNIAIDYSARYTD